MSVNLHPTNSQLSDFEAISRIPEGTLTGLVEKLSANPGAEMLSPNWLYRTCDVVVGHKQQASSLGRQLLALAGIVRRLQLSEEVVVDSLKANSDEKFQPSAEFIQLLRTPLVQMISKVIDLSYDHANLVRGMRVLTDVRPVFSEKADGVGAAVVSHTLRVFYTTISGEEEVSLALDQRDLASLRDECTRALNKAKTCQKEFSKIPIVVPGEEND